MKRSYLYTVRFATKLSRPKQVCVPLSVAILYDFFLPSTEELFLTGYQWICRITKSYLKVKQFSISLNKAASM